MHLHPETLQFFRELQMNNNREWFAANKPRWEEIRLSFVDFTQVLIDRLSAYDDTIKGLSAKKCVYRIYRDLRFTPDKRPYKTHIACYLASHGKSDGSQPGYYLHIGMSDYDLPGNVALSGGIFMPDATSLAAIRQEIYYNTEQFLSIINNEEYVKFFGREFFSTRKLQRVPKGYPADWEHAQWLKYKDYANVSTLDEKYVASETFIDKVVEVFAASVPLNKFILQATYNAQ